MTAVLIAFSDTGGGHRSAATALSDALRVADPNVDAELLDPFALSARWPFGSLNRSYPVVIEHAAWLWRTGFALTNTPRRVAMAQRLAWPAIRRTYEMIAASVAPDVIVSTHPLLTEPLRRVFPRTPIVVVVTDLVSGHSSWYDRAADLIIVPTAAARDRAVACGRDPARVVVHGIPISPRFIAMPGEQATLLSELGWSTTKPTILLIGGADGMGPLEAVSVAIDDAKLPCDLAIVAGRNASLATRLRKRQWRGTVRVYDFVGNLAGMMRAAAALVTKAGPGTISEACASGCPLVLYGAIPGQEAGNVHFVLDGDAGVWAPSPESVAAALQTWLVGPEAQSMRHRASSGARALARPHAAREIAGLVLSHAGAVHEATRLDVPLTRGPSVDQLSEDIPYITGGPVIV
ncbi:MAG: galactosyldiacylglycerol synthase [Gemmatimonadaceae bacterium]|nr:galactosyldiacylglycerol synthase [Gemmatimonadaceae bacterium]